MHEKINCKKCQKEIERIEAFPRDICKDCYAKEYAKMTPEQQVPDFTSTINL
jgi:protein-arginine kinase activator protein McsA